MFDLKSTVHKIIAEQDGPWDLDKLVAKVVAAVPARDRQEALRAALPDFLRIQLRQQSPDGIQDAPDSQSSGGAVRTPNNIRTSRIARYALHRALVRAGIVAAVGTDRGYVRIEQATVPELRTAADRNDKLAEQNKVAAQRLRKLIKLIESREVETAEGLSVEDIEEEFDREN